MANYLITGGGFQNKGAESMLYTLLTELREKDENCHIFVLLLEKNAIPDYNFKNITFVKYRNHDIKYIVNPLLFLFRKKEIINVVKKTDIIFDISGYILSSQWGKAAKHLLNIILLAKKYKKRIILLPQSFGPFDFPKNYHIGKEKLGKILSYVLIIFAREQDGLKCLQDLGLSNIQASSDIVIQSAKPYSGFGIDKSKDINVEIKDKSVLIFPNSRVFERTNKEKLLKLYREAISLMIKRDYNVYVSYYDISDKELCSDILELFKDSEKVNFLDGNIDCIQFSKLLNKFDFILSSRYHSIVHSYKNYVPALVIGWAVKYKELLHSVEQDKFMYDCREKIDVEKFLGSIDYLINNYKTESEIIKSNVLKIQQNNCFNKVWEILSK